MKILLKWLFLLGFNYCNLLGFSQLNYFLPDSNAYFSITDMKFWINGDTIINGKQYKKAYYQEHNSIPDFSLAEYYAAVREDTLNERIYTIQKYDGIERLLADFSLQPEDTITVYTFWPGIRYVADEYFLTISSKDSIEINGNYHKRLGIEGPDYDEFWIEGIGSTFGLFFPGADRNVFEGYIPMLLCVHIEDTLFYDNPEFEGCYLVPYVIIPEQELRNDKVAISYIDNKIYITSKELADYIEYRVIDTNGKILIMNSFFKTTEIDISYFPDGIYTIQIYFGNKSKFINARFIKYN